MIGRTINDPALPHIFKRQAGVTLTEISIVLGIVGVILGAVWVAFAHVENSNRMRVTNQQLVAISNNVRAIFTERGGVTGSSSSPINQGLDQLKVFPLDMRQSTDPTGIIFNLYDRTVAPNGGGFSAGTVQVYADDCTGNEGAAGAEPCFGVTFLKIPTEACIGLLTQAQQGMGLQQVITNGGGNLTPPITPTQARSNCSATNTNTILWVFTLKQ
jgi:prepilin-type N-terminal cleavage/methylation domain-containing protein